VVSTEAKRASEQRVDVTRIEFERFSATVERLKKRMAIVQLQGSTISPKMRTA
jgi:hypothetical protein